MTTGDPNSVQLLSRRTLTVIVPNYNHAHLLSRCLDSILSQSRQPDELLICDDGSTDNSQEVITSYAEKWPVIRVIRNNPNKGVLFTLHRLVQEATGELILSCAADDELCPCFIEAAMAASEMHPSLGMYLGRTNYRIDEKPGSIARDNEAAFGFSGKVSPETFSKVPLWLEAHLGTGISVSAVLNRRYWLEFLPLSTPLGPWSDVFERIAIAAKYGCYILDVPGHVFHQTEGGYSRSRSPGWHIEYVNRLILMYSLFSNPPLSPYISKYLRQQLCGKWVDFALNALKTEVNRPIKDGIVSYISVFRSLSLEGGFFAKLISKSFALLGTVQMSWLRRSLSKRFKQGVRS